MEFPVLSKKLEAASVLVFYDIEATQIDHQIIAIGMLIVRKEPGTLSLFTSDPVKYHWIIKSTSKVGSVVEKLTGISDEMVEKEGEELHDVIIKIGNILREYPNKRFISYGYFDLDVIRKNISFDDETEFNFYKNMAKNHFDFAKYLSRRIVSNKGNQCSLMKLAELYSIKEEGSNHDPLFDSVILYRIYQHYIEDEERTIDLILENYSKNKETSSIDKKITSLILEQGSVSKADLVLAIKESL